VETLCSWLRVPCEVMRLLGCLVARIVGVVFAGVVVARIAAAVAWLIALQICVVLSWVEIRAGSNPFFELLDLKATALGAAYVHGVTSCSKDVGWI
jgi:hypothetical protein